LDLCTSDLGFEFAELSHNTRISLLPGIIEAVDAGEMRISSLHNFCPLPMGVNYAAPNLFEFSAESARERDLAHRHTLKTLEKHQVHLPNGYFTQNLVQTIGNIDDGPTGINLKVQLDYAFPPERAKAVLLKLLG
jgi:hypothetical protein